MKKIIVILMLVAAVCSCSPIQPEKKNRNTLNIPPMIQEISNCSSNTIVLEFDKNVEIVNETFQVIPDIHIASITSAGKIVSVQSQETLTPGSEYFIKGTVQDEENNSTSIGASFYGFNPRTPQIVINEFTSNGSGKHPDIAELYVKSDGNIAGVTLYAGTKTTFDDKFIFPQVEVKAGDYILVHFKPQGLETEIDETTSKSSAAGYDTSDTAWDFWIRGGSGLSGNNGAITVYNSPYGELSDAVIYTNRTSDSDTSYRGFGSTKFMLQAEEIFQAGHWYSTGNEITPEDCVISTGSTATRSICRDSKSRDSDSLSDWHIVPTSKLSPGKANCDEIYQ